MMIQSKGIIFIYLIILPCYINGISPFNRRQNVGSGVTGKYINSTIGGSVGGNGNKLDVIYEWQIIDYLYDTMQLRTNAIRRGDFIPENNLPLGIARWRDRLFVTTPRWKPGIPASLSWLPLPVLNKNSPLIPYPTWDAHTSPEQPDCTKLMSVYRLHIDECNRLWVLDAGIVNATLSANQLCPPKIVIFDLIMDQQIHLFEIPPAQIMPNSLFTNILVDFRRGDCLNVFAYVADVWGNSVIVYDYKNDISWRTYNYLYLPNPLSSNYNLHSLNFQWTDGVFGLTLSHLNSYDDDRILFFHPMSSYNEFMVSTKLLRNRTVWAANSNFLDATINNQFYLIGSRGIDGQSSTTGLSRNSVMFYNLVNRDSVGCWDTRKPYNVHNLGIVDYNNETIIFPNDLKIDNEEEQGVWVLTNRLPFYLYAELDYNDINFRIQYITVDDGIRDTVCDPKVASSKINFEENVCLL